MNKTKLMIAFRISLVALLMATATVILTRHTAHAQDTPANSIVGSWQATVCVASPPGFPSFPVLMTFHGDGTLVQSRLSFIPVAPPGAVLEGTGHGAWKWSFGNQITAAFVDLLQGAPGNTALNGALWGTEKGGIVPVLSEDGKSFTATWSATITDQNGNNLLPPGNGTMTAVRIAVEP